jgi:glycosyltransferase involved in cell wall biosynthesis
MRAALDALLVTLQERRAIAASDAVISLAPLDPVEQRRWLGDKPVACNWGGVDLEYYRARTSSAAAAGPQAAPLLVFVAAFFAESAVDGAWRFAREALPEIASAYPGVRFVLVGDHRGSAAIARLVRDHARVEAVGLVEDVRPYLEAADVVVVPLVNGSGVRYKIMEALAARKPVVSTRKGAERLGLVHGRDLLLCDTVAQMAPQVIELLGDDTRRHRLAQQAQDTARDKFDRVSEHQRLVEWYGRLLAERQPDARPLIRDGAGGPCGSA